MGLLVSGLSCFSGNVRKSLSRDKEISCKNRFFCSGLKYFKETELRQALSSLELTRNGRSPSDLVHFFKTRKSKNGDNKIRLQNLKIFLNDAPFHRSSLKSCYTPELDWGGRLEIKSSSMKGSSTLSILTCLYHVNWMPVTLVSNTLIFSNKHPSISLLFNLIKTTPLYWILNIEIKSTSIYNLRKIEIRFRESLKEIEYIYYLTLRHVSKSRSPETHCGRNYIDTP